MEGVERVMCVDKGGNDTLATAALMSGGMGMGGANWFNNPFAYMMMMSMFGNGGFGGWGNRGNNDALTTLAANLNCDFNQLQQGVCGVRSAIDMVAGQVGFSAERVINAAEKGDASIIQALQNCCCQTQQSILRMGYDNQLGQKDIVNAMQQGFSYTNTGLERAASNLGFQLSQIACDLKTNSDGNYQRIVDVLNNHWNAELQQKYNDARYELSQERQSAKLIAALGTKAAAG